MKRIPAAAMLCLLAVLAGCSKVPAGNVGVIVNLYGSEKGVETREVGTGRYWVGVNEELYLFPTFTQTETWGGEEAISFQTVEGMKVGGAVGITYSVSPDKVTTLFQKYRAGIEEITNKFLRNMVRDAFNDVASKLPVESVYGAGRRTCCWPLRSACATRWHPSASTSSASITHPTWSSRRRSR